MAIILMKFIMPFLETDEPKLIIASTIKAKVLILWKIIIYGIMAD